MKKLLLVLSLAVAGSPLTHAELKPSYGNDSRSKSFRYVQFSKENEVNVSFDLEPLIWCDVHGQKLPSGLSYDVPARCARWNPQRQEFARSNLLQLLTSFIEMKLPSSSMIGLYLPLRLAS